MLLALVTSQRSPDPSTQVGAYICDTMNRNLSTGYNSVPRGIDPESISWERQAEDEFDTKYPFIVHAERNAVLNAYGSVHGAKLYVTIRPCHDCAKTIIQAGISEVIWLGDPKLDVWSRSVEEGDKLLRVAGVKVRRHEWEKPRMIECLEFLTQHPTLREQ